MAVSLKNTVAKRPAHAQDLSVGVFFMTLESITPYIPPFIGIFGGIVGGFLSGWFAHRFQRRQTLWEEKRKSYDEISKALGSAAINAEKMHLLLEWVTEPTDNTRAANTGYSAAIDTVRAFSARGAYMISREAAEELNECYIDIHNIFEHGFGDPPDIWVAVWRRLRSTVEKFNDLANKDLERRISRKPKKSEKLTP